MSVDHRWIQAFWAAKKTKTIFVLLVVLSIVLSSCALRQNPAGESEATSQSASWVEVEGNGLLGPPLLRFYRRNAYRYSPDDGWYITFIHQGQKDPAADNQNVYSFRYYNLRYVFDPSTISTTVHEAKDKLYYESIAEPAFHWGLSSESRERDMKLVNGQIVKSDTSENGYKTPEEILTLDPDDYTFEELDKDLLFDLIREALTSKPLPENSAYLDKWSTGFFWEPEKQDGYWFQICCAQMMGYVDAIYIDVLYETGSGYRDYVQLSDLVDAGTATEEQQEAFKLLRRICEWIETEECYLGPVEEYADKTIGGIDFSRLYRILKHLHESDDASMYSIQPVVLSGEWVDPSAQSTEQ